MASSFLILIPLGVLRLLILLATSPSRLLPLVDDAAVVASSPPRLLMMEGLHVVHAHPDRLRRGYQRDLRLHLQNWLI